VAGGVTDPEEWRVSGSALSQGMTAAREATRLGAELTRIARGRSDVAPAQGDRRFTDPAWTSSPVFRMIQQSYLASAQALDRVVAAMGDRHGDTVAEQAQFAGNILVSTAAPTNFLMSNPAALKRAFDTGGMSLASSPAGRWAGLSPGCVPMTWSSTTG
jgi:polyhydroxyalkanoate synthase